MRKLALTGILTLAVFVLPSIAQTTCGGIVLLDGYKHRNEPTLGVMAAAGSIYKKGGLTITYEEEMTLGQAVTRDDADKYAWYREQSIGGRLVKLALIKKGLKTGWESENPRTKEFGNILLVTFPLGVQETNAANFKAEITDETELADALLMILTFRANKP